MISLTLCRGNHAEAIINYEKGLQLNDVDEQKQDIAEHKKLCQYGIARTSIKNGDYRKGVNMMAKTMTKSTYKLINEIIHFFADKDHYCNRIKR